MIWAETQLAYLAGIIDGEGTFYIGITNKGRKFNSRIYVVNTNEELIKWLKDTFGGLIYKRTSKSNPQWKTRYEWVLDKSAIDTVCHLLIPYLIIKKKHAEIMIDYRNSFIKGKRPVISEYILAFRKACHEQIKILNHRTSSPV